MQRINFPRLEQLKGIYILLWLIFLSFLANYITISNPGFFSHDEWQKFDHVELMGAADYIREYGQLRAGPDFGFPVRPIGFLQQGLSASLMKSHPHISHAIDVAIHAVCALLLFVAMLSAGFRRREATIVASVFAVSPLSMFSTAWVGASFDRWYVLFALVTGIGVLRAINDRLTTANAALIIIGAAGAILSKETSVMLAPAIVILLAATLVLDKVRVDVKKSVSILVLISIPVVLYLLVRIPALQSSFSGHNGGAYDPTKGDVVGNALLYLAQPFLVGAVELVSAEQVPKSQWITALVLHFTLLLAIIHRYGWKAGALYLAGYFVFLLPVLPVAIVGAHYLYGSGIVFAVALGLLVSQTEGRWRLLYSGLGMALLAVGFAHSLKIQSQMKSDGQCQILMLNQLDEIIQAEKQAGKSKLVIVPDSNAPGYIAARSTFARWPYSADRGTEVQVSDQPSTNPDTANVTMGPDCRLSGAK